MLAVADLKLVAKGYNFTTFWFALVVSILDYSQVVCVKDADLSTAIRKLLTKL